MSHVLSSGLASAEQARLFFEAQLALRTDPADLAADLLAGEERIVVIDTRSAGHYAEDTSLVPSASPRHHEPGHHGSWRGTRSMSAIATASVATARPGCLQAGGARFSGQGADRWAALVAAGRLCRRHR